MNSKIILCTVGLLALFATAFYVLNPGSEKQSNGYSAEVFKSPTCGCCKVYASALEDEGFQVKATNMNDVSAIKEKHHIPGEMHSCHTAIIGKYFIEGHVPMEAINKLLNEKPDIDGIALPGMPIGTPGMPGPKESPFVIYQVKDGVYSEFMTI